jgi:Predicted metal-dependent hydrolase
MTRHDITIPLGVGVPEWPGDTPYSCRWTWEIARGASVNVSEITSSPHVGTHADAPLHVSAGWPAAHEIPLEPFIGRAFVWTVSSEATTIQPDDLRRLPIPPGGVERLLLRTGRSIAAGTFPDSWPALSVAAVRVLLERGLRLLGVDAPSVDLRASTELEVHHALFQGGAYNLENLDLREVGDGEYDLLALPLKIVDADAAPTRALLVSRD